MVDKRFMLVLIGLIVSAKVFSQFEYQLANVSCEKIGSDSFVHSFKIRNTDVTSTWYVSDDTLYAKAKNNLVVISYLSDSTFDTSFGFFDVFRDTSEFGFKKMKFANSVRPRLNVNSQKITHDGLYIINLSLIDSKGHRGLFAQMSIVYQESLGVLYLSKNIIKSDEKLEFPVELALGLSN
ncbi:MAG: hypothetical protein KDC92_17395 [Bacteroidetes bacterium]|nr:hypothetical protein [Bacteroidota bacterium]